MRYGASFACCGCSRFEHVSNKTKSIIEVLVYCTSFGRTTGTLTNVLLVHSTALVTRLHHLGWLLPKLKYVSMERTQERKGGMDVV